MVGASSSECYLQYKNKKLNVAHARLPSVGFRSWFRFLAGNVSHKRAVMARPVEKLGFPVDWAWKVVMLAAGVCFCYTTPLKMRVSVWTCMRGRSHTHAARKETITLCISMVYPVPHSICVCVVDLGDVSECGRQWLTAAAAAFHQQHAVTSIFVEISNYFRRVSTVQVFCRRTWSCYNRLQLMDCLRSFNKLFANFLYLIPLLMKRSPTLRNWFLFYTFIGRMWNNT